MSDKKRYPLKRYIKMYFRELRSKDHIDITEWRNDDYPWCPMILFRMWYLIGYIKYVYKYEHFEAD